MANIYLRVPTYVAQYYRGRIAPEPPLSEFTPVEFSQFQIEYVLMEAGLTMVNERDCEHNVCFSERMWKNILNGRPPQGGKTIINRDQTEWPGIDEVNTVAGVKRNAKTDGFDYLCIKAPKSIIIGPQIHPVTQSFTMPFGSANQLVRQLRKEFIRMLLWWVTEELLVCHKRGIPDRDVIECVDHFFYHHQMCLGTNRTDRDSMRRMAMRWLEEAKMMPPDFDIEDFFINESEVKDIGMDIDKMIKNVKQ